MTDHLPTLSEKYGIMPWHLGGEPHLSDKELEAYIKHYRDQQKREEAEAKKTSPRTPKRGRR